MATLIFLTASKAQINSLIITIMEGYILQKSMEDFDLYYCENKYSKKCSSTARINKLTLDSIFSQHSNGCKSFKRRENDVQKENIYLKKKIEWMKRESDLVAQIHEKELEIKEKELLDERILELKHKLELKEIECNELKEKNSLMSISFSNISNIGKQQEKIESSYDQCLLDKIDLSNNKGKNLEIVYSSFNLENNDISNSNEQE
jgi:predicted RNase H-like nuclease (RuvC/YqgF family)